jgi:hypothetical protein
MMCPALRNYVEKFLTSGSYSASNVTTPRYFGLGAEPSSEIEHTFALGNAAVADDDEGVLPAIFEWWSLEEL